MDEQIVELLRDRFDNLDRELKTINETIKDHVDTDTRYWKKIDQQEAQLSVVKWLTSGAAGTGLLAWLYNQFKH